jgi:GH24 family phage-related lysozyme (muramidase)
MELRISSEGLELIRHFEGFGGRPYYDAVGLLTIGYGHRIRPEEEERFASGIDVDAATTLLEADVAIAERAVTQLIRVTLIQPQFDALVSFTYNLGAGVLQRSTLRQVINRGEYKEAPHQFLRYVWAGGRKLPGLLRRRQAEAALYQH